jgi:hypothetical protein
MGCEYWEMGRLGRCTAGPEWSSLCLDSAVITRSSNPLSSPNRSSELRIFRSSHSDFDLLEHICRTQPSLSAIAIVAVFLRPRHSRWPIHPHLDFWARYSSFPLIPACFISLCLPSPIPWTIRHGCDVDQAAVLWQHSIVARTPVISDARKSKMRL